jgi:hypothetical protein
MGSHVVQLAVIYAAIGRPLAVLAFAAYDLLKVPAELALTSTSDLKTRELLKRRKLFSKLKHIPGIQRAFLLSSGRIKFEGTLAASKPQHGYVFVETEGELTPGQELAGLGEPIELSDINETRVELKLQLGDVSHPVVWDVALKDVFGHKEMPDDVADAWTQALAAQKEGLSFWARNVSRPWLKTTTVEAVLKLPDGQVRELGTLIEGAGVPDLLGLGTTKAITRFLKAAFTGRKSLSKALPVPICERLLAPSTSAPL